ncbi:MAG: transporter [Lachnospiraceae bacterium]|nr:transporter [Lachnospiraceae bacterium]
MKPKKLSTIILLHLMLLVYSTTGIFSKLAGKYPFFSVRFFLYYGLDLLVLGIYAIVWQRIIKRIPLTTAYANRAITTIWGLLWGWLLFNENITIGKIISIILVVSGIILYSLSDNEMENDNE